MCPPKFHKLIHFVPNCGDSSRPLITSGRIRMLKAIWGVRKIGASWCPYGNYFNGENVRGRRRISQFRFLDFTCNSSSIRIFNRKIHWGNNVGRNSVICFASQIAFWAHFELSCTNSFLVSETTMHSCIWYPRRKTNDARDEHQKNNEFFREPSWCDAFSTSNEKASAHTQATIASRMIAQNKLVSIRGMRGRGELNHRSIAWHEETLMEEMLLMIIFHGECIHLRKV